jgi:hypothetical protein
MEILVICIAAFSASLLTFFSGFGLGTILSAVLALFFELPVAIAITAIVHLLNNIFKLIIIGNDADKSLVLKFGIPAVIASFIGAVTLKLFSDVSPLYSYSFSGRDCHITLIKTLVAFVMIAITLLEWIPKWKSYTFKPNKLYFGGFLAGFFGGLSGHQGAFRSMFLINQNLSKTSFVATGVVLACIIDASRLPVYFKTIKTDVISTNQSTILYATLAAFIGAYLGSKMIEKVTIDWIQKIVATMVIAIAILLATGII